MTRAYVPRSAGGTRRMTAIRARAAAGARSDAPVPPPTGTSVARPSPPGRSSRRASLNCAASRGRRPRPSGGEQHSNAPRWPPETAKDVAALSDAALFLRSVDRIGEVHYATNKDLVLLQKRLGLPVVDWGRQSIRVLFVDRSDTVRARMAAGVFDVVAKWNHLAGLARAERCGMDAPAEHPLRLSTSAALLSRSHALGVPTRHCVDVCRRFIAEDLARYDLVLALDTAVHSRLLDAAHALSDEVLEPSALVSKVVLLADFFGWCSDEQLCMEGATALLPESLVEHLQPKIHEARRSPDVTRPDLDSPEGMDEWHDMNSGLLMGCASFAQYLMDGFNGRLSL